MVQRNLIVYLANGILAVVLSLSPATRAQDPKDIVITDLDIPIPKWGRQNATFIAENKSEYLRYLTIVTTIQFEGVYMNPQRSVRTHVMLEPEAKIPVITKIDVPGNYGKAELIFDVYDVFDTLDAISSTQRIYHQPITLRFTPPREVENYLQNRLNFPPYVSNTRLFDNELNHLLVQMVADSIEVGEIARRTRAESTLVQQTIDSMIGIQVLVRRDGFTRPNFPLIRLPIAEKARVLADSLADKLAVSLTKSLKQLPKVRDSLVQAGLISKDSGDFVAGGQVLYFPYPLVVGMALWTNLGQRFISSEGPVTILEQNDPCNSRTPKFLCAVSGGEYLNGSQIFNLNTINGQYEIQFGGRVPNVICPQNLAAEGGMLEHLTWRFPQEEISDPYIFDATVVTPAMAVFEKEPRQIIIDAEKQFVALCESAAIIPDQAVRYWFWNLTATATTSRLVNAGVITPGANQQYRFVLKKNRK